MRGFQSIWLGKRGNLNAHFPMHICYYSAVLSTVSAVLFIPVLMMNNNAGNKKGCTRISESGLT